MDLLIDFEKKNIIKFAMFSVFNTLHLIFTHFLEDYF